MFRLCLEPTLWAARIVPAASLVLRAQRNLAYNAHTTTAEDDSNNTQSLCYSYNAHERIESTSRWSTQVSHRKIDSGAESLARAGRPRGPWR